LNFDKKLVSNKNEGLPLLQNARLLIATQEKAKLDAKVKPTDSRILDGIEKPEELTEYELKKMEKEKQVAELKIRLEKIKQKVTTFDSFSFEL
jgi:hypothetical protein